MKYFGKKGEYSASNRKKESIKTLIASGARSQLHTNPIAKLFVGYTLVSAGIFVSASGGSWDITNHLLNKPETFFSAPHALLYSGVASAILGCAVMFRAWCSSASYYP